MKQNRIPFNEVQKALYEVLSKGQNTCEVYDSIAVEDLPLPYIWLGAFHGNPTFHNKNHAIHMISQQIDIWSDGKGKKEVNTILDEVSTLLTNYALPLNNYRQLDVNIASYQAIGERYEDKTSAYHGILVVEYTIEEID